jgi:ribonuclease HI
MRPGVEKATIGAGLARIQRLAGLSITGAMRTTPSMALNALLGFPSLSTQVKMEAIASFVRMRDTGGWRGRGDIGHTKIALSAEREVPLLAFRVAEVADQIKVDKPYILQIPSRREWEESRVILPQEALMCYTDGSRMTEARSAGAGVYLENYNTRVSYPLGEHTTVFQAEVFAIMMAASMEEVVRSELAKVCIASDSQAALRAICKPRASSALVRECGDVLERLSETKEVSLVWVPGHHGIHGNETADELARIGALTRFQGPEPALGISKQQLRSALKKWTEDCSKEQWRNTQGCRQSKIFIAGPDKARTEWLLKRSRRALNPLIGILTEHSRLRKHLHQMGLEADPICPRCGEEEETSPEIQEEDAGALE